MNPIETIRQTIRQDSANKELQAKGYEPLFVANPKARIVIIGHAPGVKAQTTMTAWGDSSGKRLMEWLGVTETEFRDETKFALIPMDFYYQGKGTSGDNPPRKGFADQWHPEILEQLNQVELMVLAGQHAVKHYLGKAMKQNLTETVRSYQDYLPLYFPIVHPSPLNFRWLGKNAWFEAEVVPKLQQLVRQILSKND